MRVWMGPKSSQNLLLKTLSRYYPEQKGETSPKLQPFDPSLHLSTKKGQATAEFFRDIREMFPEFSINFLNTWQIS